MLVGKFLLEAVKPDIDQFKANNSRPNFDSKYSDNTLPDFFSLNESENSKKNEYALETKSSENLPVKTTKKPMKRPKRKTTSHNLTELIKTTDYINMDS